MKRRCRRRQRRFSFLIFLPNSPTGFPDILNERAGRSCDRGDERGRMSGIANPAERSRVAESSTHRQFMEMLEAHGPALMSMLRRLSRGGSHDADDAFQDAAVRIWRGFAGRPRL